MPKNKTYFFVLVALAILTVFELITFQRLDWGMARVLWLMGLATVQALTIVLVYMNLRREGWALKLAFFVLIPVALYFLLFLVYDAAYIWKS